VNPTLERTLIIAIPVTAMLKGAVIAFARARTGYAACWLAGTACLGIVVLTHLAEGMRWLPTMRWGQPDSAGHYLDLTSAFLGVMLLGIGTVARITHRR